MTSMDDVSWASTTYGEADEIWLCLDGKLVCTERVTGEGRFKITWEADGTFKLEYYDDGG